jgi:hypothetical protein
MSRLWTSAGSSGLLSVHLAGFLTDPTAGQPVKSGQNRISKVAKECGDEAVRWKDVHGFHYGMRR